MNQESDINSDIQTNTSPDQETASQNSYIPTPENISSEELEKTPITNQDNQPAVVSNTKPKSGSKKILIFLIIILIIISIGLFMLIRGQISLPFTKTQTTTTPTIMPQTTTVPTEKIQDLSINGAIDSTEKELDSAIKEIDQVLDEIENDLSEETNIEIE